MRETDARIEATLRMDYDTFTNASFFLQGRADQFAQQRPGDRKRVLSNILGLEIWEDYRNNTVERRKNVETEMKSVDGLLAEIELELAQELKRKARLAEVEARLAQLQLLCQAKETSLANLQRLASSLDEQKRMVNFLARGLNEARARYEHIRSQLEQLNTERELYQQVLNCEGEVTAAYARWQNLPK